jgi:2-polyprenyl-6-methoxyphenol hydroxylase-like FAD-dependent oxidoreductase
VLQHIGVYDKIRTHGYNYEEVGMNNDSGQQLATFLNGSEKLYHFYSICVHRKIVQLKLLEEAEEQGVAIHYGMKLIDVNEDDVSGVELIFENGVTVTADFVVGAGRVHSRTRSAVSNTAPKYSGLSITGMARSDIG